MVFGFENSRTALPDVVAPGHAGLFKFFFLFYILLIFERDRERESTHGCTQVGEGQRERGDPESEAGSRLRAVSTEPDAGLGPTNPEIVT